MVTAGQDISQKTEFPDLEVNSLSSIKGQVVDRNETRPARADRRVMIQKPHLGSFGVILGDEASFIYAWDHRSCYVPCVARATVL